MHLLLVGLSHRTAPVELRERVDFQARDLQAALRALAGRGSAREAVQLPDDDPIHAVETRVGDEAVEGRARGPVLMLLDLLEPHAPAASFDVPP